MCVMGIVSDHVYVCYGYRQRSCICVLWVSSAIMYMCVMGIEFASVSTIALMDFGIVPTIWYLIFFFFIIFQNGSSFNKLSFNQV